MHTFTWIATIGWMFASLGVLAEDAKEPSGASPPNAALRVTEAPGGVTIDTGAIRFQLRDEGVLQSLEVGPKALVADNRAPLMAAEVFESSQYDGYRDAVPGKIIPATWKPESHEYRPAGKVAGNSEGARDFQATYSGRLDFGAGDAIVCRLVLSARAGSPLIEVAVELQPQGKFQDRFLRDLAIRLPLALNQRKRVVQAGDRGVQWNTRHWYQFHVSTRSTLLPEPDHNIWRLFAVDQDTPTDYHIWRSESTATCPLSVQRGLQAPGWMAVYDQQAGLLFAYRGLAARAPKSLRVTAQGTGEAAVHLWHSSLPALDLQSPQASAVFGARHTTDWMAFPGEFGASRPDAALARQWGLKKLDSDPPARNEVPLEGLNPLAATMADADAPAVTGGVPLPKGALRDPAHVRLRCRDADVPLQARAVAWWPDQSIKWLLLTFPADGGAVHGASGEGETLPLELTRRDGSKTAYRLDYGGGVRMGRPQAALAVQQQADRVVIDTGPLQLELRAGRQWLPSVKLQGREMLARGGASSFVDFLRTQQNVPCMTTHAQGTPDDGGFSAKTIQLEEAGPLRAVVRLEGMTSSKEPARVILRLEAYAGRSVVRLFHTAEFLHKDPRAAFVRRMGVELPLAATGQARLAAGGQEGPLSLPPGVRAGLRQHSHLGYQAWHQVPGERFQRIDQTRHRSRGWLDLSGPQGGVAVVLRDMWQQFPNELTAEVEGSRLTACFWPESRSVMDIRRYSNYPHLSQGESTPSDSRWVPESYYPKDPIVGISKTHELLVYFHGPEVDGKRIDAVVADFHRPPLVFAGGDYYVRTGSVLPQSLPSSDRFPRAHANLDHYLRFWLHHQKLWGWYGFWDYGDVQHHYKRGYGAIVPADKLVELLKDRPKDGKIDVSRWRRQDYTPDQEWAFDNGRWGWNNTEGLPGLYAQNHYLRTGDREMFFFAEAMARHFRDVDMRHDGLWLGLGTRHGVQHWSDGNHEERQTTHSEFRYVHYLTGDMRSRDFAQQLFQRVYSQRPVSKHAAHSGRLQGLLTWWEMTGSKDVEAMLAKYVPSFVVAEGICESPSVRFPGPEWTSQDRDVNDANMFFWTFGAGHGLLEYYYLTDDDRLRRALIRVADLAMQRPDPNNFRKAVVFAARHADDPAPYVRYLETWARSSPYVFQVVPHNRLFYGGPGGMLQGSVSGSLFTMNDIPYLLSALPGDPRVSDQQREVMRQIDANGAAVRPPLVLDWQSAYDRDELKEYLRIKHPQP